MYSTQQNIIETLSSFRIDVEAGDITRGPSITRYEFYPPKGLKLNRISNLADNLRMSTQSKSINILAPIPGKNTVGIELENEFKSPVYLRELLQSEAFHSPKLRIPVALGKDVYGTPVIGDLAAMPHTLVAGTTGSGKSVCVNSMILSMLYKFRPDELRLILVDPKVVEMQPYKKLPHLKVRELLVRLHFHHLGVHENEAEFIRAELVEHGKNHAVHANGFTGTGGTGYKSVGHSC